jgi:hypothetical protein
MTNPPTPPPLPSESRRSFFHQAATAGVFAPLLAIVAYIVSVGAQSGLDPQTKATVSLVIGICNICILLLGLVCGIIALCGIGKHGRKGLLAKGICGILIPLLIFGAAIPAVMALKSRGLYGNMSLKSVDEMLKLVADKINSQGGRVIDADTRLEGAEALPGRKLLYKYTIVTKSASEVQLDALNGLIRPKLVKIYNSEPDMKLFRDNGVTIIYRYSDKTGQLVGDVSVGPDDLAK